jgi:hypothetical protein
MNMPKKCAFVDQERVRCGIRPYYNVKGETKGIYCLEHKVEHMINVVSPRCIFQGCTIQAIYNNIGKTIPVYCFEHKESGMSNIKIKRCSHINCETRPMFNYEGFTKPKFCNQHKTPEMVNVVSRTCRNEWCKIIVLTDKHYGYCLNCFIHAHPDKPVSRNYKTKERCVVEYITSHFQDFSWVSDKKITDGCSNRRPDLMLELGYQVIVVEVDENQHIDYDCSCENKRIMELSQDVGHKPIIFIRFNPDEYTDENGDCVTSCWGVNKLGLCVVKKSKEKDWELRLERLREQVAYWTNPSNSTEKTVEIVELFYDCD